MITALAAQGVRPRTIIDVGANVGQFTVAAAKIFGGQTKIHAFEPHPACVAKLRRNVRRLTNVVVHPAALADRAAEVEFRANANHRASSLLALGRAHLDAFPSAREVALLTTRTTTLDQVFHGADLRQPVLLKLDVQGAEGLVLAGATTTLQRVDWVVLEASFRPMYDGETLFSGLARTMDGRGFRFARPVGFLAHPRTGEVLQMDALFVRADGCGDRASPETSRAGRAAARLA
jgi:FkbM family methyltransferase